MNTRKLVSLSLGLVVALGVVTTSCAPPTLPPTPTSRPEEATATPVPPTPTPTLVPAPSTSEVAEEEGPITIGAVFNEVGWMAAYDQPPRKAALLAIADINAQGGVLGRELVLIERDGKTDPAMVGSAARDLVEQGADVLVAPCDFDVGGPVSEVAQGEGLVGVSTCATSPLYGSLSLGDMQFTVGMWGNTMGAAMAGYGYQELDWRTAYVLVDTSVDYTLSLGEYFAEHFETLGGEVVGQDTYTAGAEDFSAQVERIQALPSQPDVLYVSGIMPDLAIVLQQIREAGIETPLAGGDTYDDTTLYAQLGPELANDLYMATHSWLGPEAGWEMSRFIDLYEEEYGEPPASSFIVMGWDTVQILAQAIGTTGTTDGARLADAMERIQFDLLSGNLDWTSAEEGHQPLKAAAIVEVQGGEPSFLGWFKPEAVPEP